MNIPCKLLVTFFANKNLIPILSDELNAQKFYNTTYRNSLHPSTLYQLNAEWYIGNYKKLIALSLAGFKHSKNIQKKCIYLVYLARAYFDIRDYRKLNEVVTAFYQMQEDSKKSRKLLTQYPTFEYYKAYLDGNFERCVSITQNRIERIQNKRSNGKLLWLTNQSNLAIAYYELKEFEKAKEIFLWFSKTTPNLNNFYTISAMYLEAIEKNIPPCSISQSDEEENVQVELDHLSLIKKEKIKRTILYVLIIVLIIAFAITDFFRYSETGQEQNNYNSAITEYENDLRIAISKNYDNAKFIKYFNVRDGEQHIDAFCLIDTGDGWDLANIVTYDGGETLDLMLLGENIQIERDYTVKSTTSNYQIALYISDKPLSSSDYKQIIEYSHNDTNYWFGIKQTTQLP